MTSFVRPRFTWQPTYPPIMTSLIWPIFTWQPKYQPITMPLLFLFHVHVVSCIAFRSTSYPSHLHFCLTSHNHVNLDTSTSFASVPATQSDPHYHRCWHLSRLFLDVWYILHHRHTTTPTPPPPQQHRHHNSALVHLDIAAFAWNLIHFCLADCRYSGGIVSHLTRWWNLNNFYCKIQVKI